MASGTSAADADHGNEVSAAQKLLQMHQPTVEDVPENDDSVGFEYDPVPEPASAPSAAGDANGTSASGSAWPAAPSAKAAGESTAGAEPTGTSAPVPAPAPAAKLDTQSHELFPELGGPKKTAAVVAPVWSAKTSGKVNGNAVANGSSAPAAAPATNGTTLSAAAPPPASRPPALNIPGRNSTIVSLPDSDFLPRTALKRPIQDIIKDINRKSRANITMLAPSGGQKHFSITGPPEIADQALRELVQQIGAKVTATVAIPQSARAFIIGKQGSTIKSIQEKTGARIQVPRSDGVTTAADDDDDSPINLTIEGNVLSARDARDAIMKIVGERFANVNTRVRGIPTEFYPFIADPKNGLLSNLESSGVQVRVPPLQPWSSRPPQVSSAAGRPIFSPPVTDNHIQLAGERAAVQNARAEIEKLAAELHQRLHVQQTSISRGQQQFIIGNNGMPMEDFYNETGCAIVLPENDDDDLVSIIGPADQVEAGLDRAIDLATGMRCSNYDISRVHRQAPSSHAQNVTRYLRKRKEIERLEKAYRASINTPFSNEGALPWEIYSRDAKDGIRAQTEIRNIVSGLPPARMAHLPVDSFYHAFLQTDVRPRLQQQYGVYLVVPDASETTAPVVLVYEGPSDEPFTVPQSVPSPQELAAFQEAVRSAEQHIRSLLEAQDEIKSIVIDVPIKHHDRLKKFIRAEQDKRQANQPAVRVSNTGTSVTLRGPKTLVEQLTAKVTAFVEQEKQDEKERGFTLTFDFPKAYANHLIGKGGSNIRELRDKFDVEIQVEDGKVELKGPKAKAEAARAHINSVARHLADETTYTLKIEPKFHRELIGTQGVTINRLQTRYKVLIFFPRLAKTVRDDESFTDTTSDSGKPRRQQAPDEVIIRGPKKGADEAREEILKLYLYLMETSFSDKVEVLQKQIPYLIGQGGSAMEAIRQQTGAKIDVPNSRGDPESTVEILLKGTKEQVAAAKKLLAEKKVILDDTVIKTIEVDKKYHKALIGSGGSQLREIVIKAGGSDDRRELAKAIQFPSHESTDGTIKVEGRRAFVDKVIDIINEFVSERASEVVEVIDVPQEKHRMLIGRNGETRRNIETEFGVTLGVPRVTEKRTDVKIIGKPSNVAQAKEKIQSILQASSAATVDVPRRVHHAVSNGGQIFRRLRSELRVTVDHNGEAVPVLATPLSKSSASNQALPLITDDVDAAAGAHSWNVVETTSTETGTIPWVLRGTPENIEKAKKAVLKALETAGEDKVTGYLTLPDTSVYRHIVGVQGKTIEAIRKESGCRIFVPNSKNDGQGAIEIVGSKDGVETAKELIITAVKEGAQK